MELGETRFYTYRAADGQVVGPLAYDQVCQLHSEALVAIAGGTEWWPARRWKPDGTLTVTLNEQARAWWWVLIAAPGAVYMFWPQLWRMEWFVGWSVLMLIIMGVLACTRREYPRFPGSGLST